MSVRIRLATSLDRDDIRDVHLSAFPECESQLVAELAANLLNEDTDPETITLVAEAGGQVVGHIAFSPVTADSRNRWLGYILGPLGVKPEHHKAGIGSKLVKSGIGCRKKGSMSFSCMATPRFTGDSGSAWKRRPGSCRPTS